MNEKIFTKTDTKCIKGVAVLLMLWHHLFNDTRIYCYTEISGIGKYNIIFAKLLGNICVSIFLFMGGYGSFRQLQKSKKINILKKIKGLYVSYWRIFLPFVVIGILFFQQQPNYCQDVFICHVFDHITWKTFLLNMLCLSSDINREHWFLSCYIITLLLFGIYAKWLQEFSIRSTIIFFIAYYLFTFFGLFLLGQQFGWMNDGFYKKILATNSFWSVLFLTGCICAKYDLLEKFMLFEKNNTHFTWHLQLLLMFLLVSLRMLCSYLFIYYLEFLIVPFFVFIVILWLRKIKRLYSIVTKVGQYSTNMWLIHTFLCYYYIFTAKLIYSLRFQFLEYLLFCLIVYILAIIIDKVWNYIVNIKKVVSNEQPNGSQNQNIVK